jgi:hypothetical protein
MSKKGSGYERDVCRQLSRWWTNGERDDVFWRTPGSGAMATSRAKQGKQTFGQFGDVQAVDPVGAQLISWATIEIKRGYSGESFGAILDGPCSQWGKWVEKAESDSRRAISEGWAIIAKRDRRMPVICCPAYLYESIDMPDPANTLGGPVAVICWEGRDLVVARFEEFLREVTPGMIRG